MDEISKRITVPLQRKKLLLGGFVLGALIFVICTIDYANWKSDYEAQYLPIFLALPVVLVAVLRYCIHYRFERSGLIVLFLMIPIRKIRWSSITCAEYIRRWRIPQNRIWSSYTHGNIIYITLRHCAGYDPLKQTRLWHNIRHPLKALTVWLPEDNCNTYVDVFQNYYPNLLIQEEK